MTSRVQNGSSSDRSACRSSSLSRSAYDMMITESRMKWCAKYARTTPQLWDSQSKWRLSSSCFSTWSCCSFFNICFPITNWFSISPFNTMSCKLGQTFTYAARNVSSAGTLVVLAPGSSIRCFFKHQCTRAISGCNFSNMSLRMVENELSLGMNGSRRDMRLWKPWKLVSGSGKLTESTEREDRFASISSSHCDPRIFWFSPMHRRQSNW
mmetsp:Transcript_22123/g.55506  ORF Transcript_22123/g.55506 Transcript_22123/m.55506 type:complete len:210 (-) Transcript_22123:939-1568(-)